MVDGIPGLDSPGKSGGIRIISDGEPIKKRGMVQLLFLNESDQAFDVGAESVSATLDDGTAVTIISPAQLAKEERSRQTWRAIGAGLAAVSAGMNAANAGYSHGTVSARSFTSGTYGSSSTTAFGTYSSYNAGQAANAQALANLQNQQTFDRLAVANANGKEALRAFLRTTTVDPGDAKGGLITIELPKSVRKSKVPVNVTFNVKTGTETHVVKAQLVPTR